MTKKCPYVKEECWEHGCEFYIHLIGRHPQTGEEQDEWGCSLRWLPVLLVENASWIRKATASTDKVATNVFNHHKDFCRAISEANDKRKRIESVKINNEIEDGQDKA